MATDGPQYLRDVAMNLRRMGFPISAPSLEQLAAAWEAEREQAAADRAALATAQHANDAERGEWSEYYELLTGDRGAWSPDDMRRAVKAQIDALAQARALLPEELTECVAGSGYERCWCANVDKDNHCMYCLYPPWVHDLAQALSGAR